MAIPAVETVRALKSTFAKLRLRWYLFGAQAVILYGVARSTLDLDVTVEPGSRSMADIAKALVANGFALKFTDEAFVRQTGVLPITHSSGLPVDVVLGGPGFEELFLSRVVKMRMGGVVVPVATAEDIVAMKILASREKDLADVRSLVAVLGKKLDLRTVRETLALLEEALGQSDLLPAFEALVARARRR